MDISAISSLASLGTTGITGTQQSTDGTSMFKDIYNGLIDNVNQTDSAFQGDIVKAAEGELDNPEQLAIDSSKAQIALQMFTSVRNDALDAYNDVIKMQV